MRVSLLKSKVYYPKSLSTSKSQVPVLFSLELIAFDTSDSLVKRIAHSMVSSNSSFIESFVENLRLSETKMDKIRTKRPGMITRMN